METKLANEKKRDLSIMLVRIVAMLFIFIDHLVLYIDVPLKNVILQITNSGVLPDKLVSGKSKVLPHGSVLRNPLMAEVFYVAGEMEKTGRGMYLISNTMKEAGRKLPEWFQGVCIMKKRVISSYPTVSAVRTPMSRSTEEPSAVPPVAPRPAANVPPSRSPAAPSKAAKRILWRSTATEPKYPFTKRRSGRDIPSITGKAPNIIRTTPIP